MAIILITGGTGLVGKALTNHFPYDRITDDNELSDEIMIGK